MGMSKEELRKKLLEDELADAFDSYFAPVIDEAVDEYFDGPKAAEAMKRIPGSELLKLYDDYTGAMHTIVDAPHDKTVKEIQKLRAEILRRLGEVGI